MPPADPYFLTLKTGILYKSSGWEPLHMVVINALRDALSMLRRQPVLFVPMIVFALLQVPQLFLNTLDPMLSLVGSLVVTAVFAFVTPVFYAGTIGMADDAAADRETSLGRFWSHAKEHYLSMLGAYLLIFAISFGFSFLVSVVGTLAFAAVLGTDPGLGVTVAVGAVGALVVLLYLVALFALHFYGHAIVIEDYGVTGALSRSVSVVRHNIVSVLGYGALLTVFGGLIGVVYAVFIVAMAPIETPGEPTSMSEFIPLILGSTGIFVITALIGTFFVAFSVALYRSLIDVDDDTTAGTGAVGAGSHSDDGAELAG